MKNLTKVFLFVWCVMFYVHGKQLMSWQDGFTKLQVICLQGHIISLTGLSALSIAVWKPNVTSLELEFEREDNRNVISL